MIGQQARSAWDQGTEARSLLVRFHEPARLLETVPGGGARDHDLRARLLGMTPAELARHESEFSAAVDRSGELVLADRRSAAAVDRIRSAAHGETVVVYGDSITADLASWGRVVHALLAPDLVVVNSARAGDTTTDLLSRYHLGVAPHRPRFTVILGGTNDARRYAARPEDDAFGDIAVSHLETLRNVRELDRLVLRLTGRRALWLSPPRVDDFRIRAHPALRQALAVWQDADVATKREGLQREFGERVAPLTAPAGGEDMLMADGLHPNEAGQVQLARAALRLIEADLDRP